MHIIYYFFTVPFILLAILGVNSEWNRKLSSLWPFFLILIVLFVGLRYESVDYYNYLLLFDRTDFDSFAFPFY